MLVSIENGPIKKLFSLDAALRQHQLIQCRPSVYEANWPKRFT